MIRNISRVAIGMGVPGMRSPLPTPTCSAHAGGGDLLRWRTQGGARSSLALGYYQVAPAELQIGAAPRIVESTAS
jgi:hypothetical protein